MSDNADPSTVYLNPANVISGRRVYLYGSTLHFADPYELGISLRSIDGGGSWQFSEGSAWTLGAHAAYTQMGIDETIGENGDNVWSLALGVGVDERNIHLRAGAAFKRLQFQYLSYDDYYNSSHYEKGEGYASDAGLVLAYHHGDEAGWNVVPQVGFSHINVGDDIRTSGDTLELPSSTVFGASLRLASPMSELVGARVPGFTTILNVDHKSDEYDEGMWHAGGEISLAMIVHARVGVGESESGNGIMTWGLGLGFPYRWLRVRVDYAQQDNDYVEDQMSLLVSGEF